MVGIQAFGKKGRMKFPNADVALRLFRGEQKAQFHLLRRKLFKCPLAKHLKLGIICNEVDLHPYLPTVGRPFFLVYGR